MSTHPEHPAAQYRNAYIGAPSAADTPARPILIEETVSA